MSKNSQLCGRRFRHSFGFRHSSFGFENCSLFNQKAGQRTGEGGRGWVGSWRAPSVLRSCIGTLNRSVWTPLVGSPAFRRSGPAKAGTPNGRFIESLLSFFRMHWDHEPTPTKPPGRGTDTARPNARSPPGRGRGGFVADKFMKSPHGAWSRIGTMNRLLLVL